MTEQYGDPTTAHFWEAARRHELVVQRCEACDRRQFYPRPFCLGCLGRDLSWVQVSGRAVVYAQTTNRLAVLPELEPPYVVALVDLEEGPRLLTNIVGDPVAIGERVVLDWRERADAPPLPVFRRG